MYIYIYHPICLYTKSYKIRLLRIECRLRTGVYPHIIWHSRIHCQRGTSNRLFGSRPTAVPEKSKAMRKPLFTCHRHWSRLLQEPTSIHSRSDNLRFAVTIIIRMMAISYTLRCKITFIKIRWRWRERERGIQIYNKDHPISWYNSYKDSYIDISEVYYQRSQVISPNIRINHY